MVELDIGYVGEVTRVDPTILNVLGNDSYIPVVATIATDASGQALNINADTAAGEVRYDVLCALYYTWHYDTPHTLVGSIPRRTHVYHLQLGRFTRTLFAAALKARRGHPRPH